MISSKPYIEDYKGFLIADLSDGIVEPPVDTKIVVFLVEWGDTSAYFAFCDARSVPETDDFIKQLAVESIKKTLDSHTIQNHEIYTFELKNKGFAAVENPKWWGLIARDYKFQ